MKRRNAAVLSILTIAFWSGAARAQESPAQVLFNQAATEFEQGNYDAACPHFEESYNQDTNLGTLLSLAICLTKQGKMASAFKRYQQFVDAFSKLDSSTKAKRKGTLKEASSALQALESRVPRLKLTLPTDRPAGLLVWLDGSVVPASEVEQERMVDPGNHKLIVVIASGSSAEQEILIGDGEHAELTIRLPPAPSPPPPIEPVKPKPIAPAPPDQRRATVKKVAIVTGVSIAGLGAVTTIVAGAIAAQKNSEIGTHCINNLCDTDAWTQKAREAQTVEHVAIESAIVTGVAGLAMGGVFLTEYLRGRKVDVAKPQVQSGVLKCDSTGLVLGMKGTF